MNPTLLLSDPLFTRHDPGRGHPECPARLESIHALLTRAPLPGLLHASPRPARQEELLLAHSPALLAQLASFRGQRAQLDPDTGMSADSYDAAVLAAGAAVGAVEAVLQGRARNAFALVRPPGPPRRAGARHGLLPASTTWPWRREAARRLGAERVLVLDWDVHHGNGTQDLFERGATCSTSPSHQFPFYPGTGAAARGGRGRGRGLHRQLRPARRLHGRGLRRGLPRPASCPSAQAFRPDLVLVSAGFDAARATTRWAAWR